ncbi:MAG: hypothetical protein EP335_16325 [Alphaproteobacteria bacterium]|nr:MAG: hypothetical protein EP335_16325 [Alphaproteobacteria bacterium]
MAEPLPGAEPVSVISVYRTPRWRDLVAACLKEGEAGGQLFKDSEFLSGSVATDSVDLQLIIIETGNDLDFFRAAMTCIDAGFLQAGGPVIAVVGPEARKLDDILLMMGASRVIEDSINQAGLARLIASDAVDYHHARRLRADIERRAMAIGEVTQGTFRLRSRREAQNLSTLLSFGSRDPRPVAMGLSELIINGIEHGCLRIGHDEKGKLIEEGKLTAEIRRRRGLPEYAGRMVTVRYERFDDRLEFIISDPGDGFDFVAMANHEAAHLKKHGRGILMARSCFDRLEFSGNGNTVKVVHLLT